MTPELVYLLLGAALLLASVLPGVLHRWALSAPIVLVATGMVFGLIPAADDVRLDPVAARPVIEHLAEITVLVALMGVGLAIDRPLRWRVRASWAAWSPTWRLLGIAMPLTIGGVALLAWGPLGVALPAAVLLDIRLPGMHGLQLLEVLKSRTNLRHIPVHMISVEDRSHEALQLGAAGFRRLAFFNGHGGNMAVLDAAAAWLDRVEIVAEYDDVVRSPSTVIRIPSVVVLKDYVKPRKRVAFTRFNLFLRDEFCCQYCGAKGELTFDHVIPRAAGGVTSWENVVAACSPCNLRKGSKSLRQIGFQLQRTPRAPDAAALHNVGRKFPPDHLHKSWLDFLYWGAELDA